MALYLIESDDLDALARLMTRLHSETRMYGDDMRDWGHTLEAIVRTSRDYGELPPPRKSPRLTEAKGLLRWALDYLGGWPRSPEQRHCREAILTFLRTIPPDEEDT